jgi:hypothetical protein
MTAVAMELAQKGYLDFTGTYGDKVVVIPVAGNTVYSPKTFGLMTATYTKKKLKLPFVPGVTVFDAGTTNLNVKIKATKNNEKIEASVPVVIEKADPQLTKKPTAKEGLVYNDRYQELVTPGKAKGGTIYYAIDGGSTLKWSKSVPTAKDATDTGDTDTPYAVKYKIVPDNDNYKEIESNEVLHVSIASKAKEDEESEDDFDLLAPGKVKLVTVTKINKKNAVVKFKRVDDADHYEFVVTDKDGKTVKSGKVEQDVTKFIQTKVKKLTKNTSYKVKVRAVSVFEGKEHYGAWSRAVSFKTKK